MHELIDEVRVRKGRGVTIWRLGVLAGQRRVVFNDVVFGEVIKIDSSSVPAEENAGKGQEISQRFREVVYALHCLDEGVHSEVPAVAITGSSQPSVTARDLSNCSIHVSMICKCVQGRTGGA